MKGSVKLFSLADPVCITMTNSNTSIILGCIHELAPAPLCIGTIVREHDLRLGISVTSFVEGVLIYKPALAPLCIGTRSREHYPRLSRVFHTTTVVLHMCASTPFESTCTFYVLLLQGASTDVHCFCTAYVSWHSWVFAYYSVRTQVQ